MKWIFVFGMLLLVLSLVGADLSDEIVFYYSFEVLPRPLAMAIVELNPYGIAQSNIAQYFLQL